MTEFDEAFAEVMADMGEVSGTVQFVFRGRRLTGLVTKLTAAEKLAVGGSIPGLTQTLMFGYQVFHPEPREGEYVEIAGRKLRIGPIETDEVSITFPLCDPNE